MEAQGRSRAPGHGVAHGAAGGADANTLLTPFLPHAAQKVHEALGGTGVWAAQPELFEVADLDLPDRVNPIITGDYTVEQARWESVPIEVGRPLEKPTPLFANSIRSSPRPDPNGLRLTSRHES